jgi:hypothetical protein
VSNDIQNSDPISRREFTVEAVMALLAGVTITVSGCGGDTEPSTPTSPTPGGSTNVNGTISANHGHTATITAMQISTAGAVTLNIQGTATHPHTIALTAQEVQAIGARTQVTKTSSSDDGHTHTVTFN